MGVKPLLKFIGGLRGDKGPHPRVAVVGTNIIYVSVRSDAKAVAYGTQTFGQELWTLEPVNPQ